MITDEERKLVERLRDTPNWMKEDFGDWKTSKTRYDRAPFEAAYLIERNDEARATIRREARREALEEAVQVADVKPRKGGRTLNSDHHAGIRHGRAEAAKLIRALMEEQNDD